MNKTLKKHLLIKLKHLLPFLIFTVLIFSLYLILPISPSSEAGLSVNDNGGASHGWYDYGQSSNGDSGYGSDSGYGDNSYNDSGYADGGYGDAGYGDSGYGGNDNGYGSGGDSGYPPGPRYNLTGFVYADNNNNGSPDTGDTGLTEEQILLLNNSNGAIEAEAQTIGGYYSITRIIPRDYTVSHNRNTLWPGWVRTTDRQLALTINSDTSVNFGMRAFMEGYVYQDNNRNGSFDDGDSGVASQTVVLLNNSNGAEIARLSTNGSGYYRFDPVPYNAGGYTIRHITLPSGWIRTTFYQESKAMLNFSSTSFGIDDDPTPIGDIAASPNPCTIPYGGTTCTTTISWSTVNSKGTVLAVARYNSGTIGSGTSGSVSINWIGDAGHWFDLYDNGVLLDSVFVDGTPTASTFKIQSVTVNCLPSQSMTITWDPYPGATSSTIYRVRYMPQETGHAYTYWNDIAHNGSHPYSTSISVTGDNDTGLVHTWNYQFSVQAETPINNPVALTDGGYWTAGTLGWKAMNCTPVTSLSANPNPCAIPVGQTTCPSTLSWTTTNLDWVEIYRRSDGAPAYIGPNVNGSAGITVNDAGAWYDLWGNSLEKSVFVEGNYNAATNPPTVTLRINSTNHGGLPAVVNQNTAANIYWTANQATSCSSSLGAANPAPQPNWSSATFPLPGQVGSGGPIALNTSIPGSYVFTLGCTNTAGNRVISIQMNVEQYPKPYIQTTGGDVHTNETIYIGN